MAEVTATVEVDVPVSVAYNQWTQFEEFPRFMEGVEEVQQLDDARLHWRAEIGGVEREWDAQITEQDPDRLIAWQSTTGVRQAGRVFFEPVDHDRTRIDLTMFHEPEEFAENVGQALGIIERRVHDDLDRFKEFIEERGIETGAWRGEIHGGQPETGVEDTAPLADPTDYETGQFGH
ncbi:MAG: SRPBCC family protein [Actinomycetes bacterium]